MFPLWIVTILVALSASAKRRVEMDQLLDDYGELFWSVRFAKKSKKTEKKLRSVRKRIIELLSIDGLLIERFEDDMRDKELIKTAVRSNPYALSFLHRSSKLSKAFYRNMTKLAWKIAKKRGIDLKPLVKYSDNVPEAFNFIVDTVKDGHLVDSEIPEWFSRRKSNQMLLARYCPKALVDFYSKRFRQYFRLDVGMDVIHEVVRHHPTNFPIDLFFTGRFRMSGKTDELVSAIREFGVDVLLPFFENFFDYSDNYYRFDKTAFSKEERTFYLSGLDEYDLRDDFPFNEQEVFDAVFDINPFVALNWFNTDLFHTGRDKWITWSMAIEINPKAIVFVDRWDLTEFYLRLRFGSDLGRFIKSFLRG